MTDDELEAMTEAELDAEIKRLTPSADELREFAKKHPPPQEWFDHDEPLPFGEEECSDGN